MKIHKRIDVTDEIAINIPKKAIFSIFNASPLLLLKLWEIVCNFFTYFNWLLDGPKILVTTPPQPPGLHPGPCLQALIFHWQCCEILTFFWRGGGGRDPVRWASTLYETRFHYTYKERSAHRRHIFSQNCWQSSFTSIVSRRTYCISIGFCKTTHQPLP